MTTKKQTKPVTVELLFSEAERLAEGLTRWSVKCGDRRVTIGHLHTKKNRDYYVNGAWFYAEDSGLRLTEIHERDFGAALTVARKMLGVRS